MKILDVRVDDVTYAETVQWVASKIDAGGTHLIATVNPEFIMRAQNDAAFAKVLDEAALNVPDGVGVLWAAKRMGQPMRERVAGSTLLPMLCERAAADGWRVFFLGGRGDVAEQCAARMQARFPGLIVAGAMAGSPLPQDDAAQVAHIRATRPHLIFVAYGAPKQEFWLARNLDKFKIENEKLKIEDEAANFSFSILNFPFPPGVVGIGVGGAFDFMTGNKKRAPEWMQRLGLEWLYRLLQEPWRWRRQYWLLFVLRVWLKI